MKLKLTSKFKKKFLIVNGSVILAIVVMMLLLAPLEKYLFVKYTQKYLGRQIKLSWIYINPFTGHVYISNLKIYESAALPEFKTGDHLFFAANSVSADFAILKLLSKTVEIRNITLDNPIGIIILDRKELNFRDLIKIFTPKTPNKTPSKFHFNILKISIKNGTFLYWEKATPFNYFIQNVNIESSEKRWNQDTLAVSYAFRSGPSSGSAKGNFSINFKNLKYRLVAVLQTYDLDFLQQYLDNLANYGRFRSTLNANIIASGSFKDNEDLIAKGLLEFKDFHIGKTPGEDYASFDGLIFRIIELSPKNHQYRFDSVSLTHPFFKYERYDYLDNLQRMFGKKGGNLTTADADAEKFNLILTLARYIRDLAQNFFQSEYTINRLAIYQGDFKFNDFAITEKFSVALNPFYFTADSIGRNQKKVNAFLKSGLQPYGNITINITVDPKVKGDFDVQYHLLKLPVSLFNPYLIRYTSYPADRGTLELNGAWNVRNGIIHSVNHLVIIDPRTTKRFKNKNTNWIPLPLVMALIRDKGNVIDYEIPITGNLKNPKFHLHDVIMDLLTNIIVKPATTFYRMEVKKSETEIEKSLSLKWQPSQSLLHQQQEKFVKSMVDFLIQNPKASISVAPMQYDEKEKEHIAFFEAKKKYFISANNKTGNPDEADSMKIEKLSVKDPKVVNYLNKMLNDSLLFTIQDKCEKLIGKAKINAFYERLNKDRQQDFLRLFKEKELESRIRILPGESSIPYNGFSFYKIIYHGEFSKALLKAYQKMNEFDNEAPRKKFKKERKESKSSVQNKATQK